MALGVLNPKDPIQKALDQMVQTLKKDLVPRVQTLKVLGQRGQTPKILGQRGQTPKVFLNPEAVEHSGAVQRLKPKVEPD